MFMNSIYKRTEMGMNRYREDGDGWTLVPKH
jgi:hypothetical protein